MKFKPIVLILLLAGAVLWSCGDSVTGPTGAASGRVQIRLTDAPADLIDTALVTISKVILKADDDDSTLSDVVLRDSLLTVDLLTLRDGLDTLLADAMVPEGDYEQLRLVVVDAWVSLIEGYHFTDGSTSAHLDIPSGMTSGIKVLLDAPVPADSGMVTVVTVDFDVRDNFRILGDPDSPDGVKGVKFVPTLNEKGRTRHLDGDDDDSTGTGDDPDTTGTDDEPDSTGTED